MQENDDEAYVIYTDMDNNVKIDHDDHFNIDDVNNMSPRPKRGRTFIESWAQVSHGIESSIKLHLENTIQSLVDIPSNDRRSSGLLMSVNLQSMVLGTTLLSIPYCVKMAGVWALVLIIVIGILANFTANILADCQYQESVSDPPFRKRIHTSFVSMCVSCWRMTGGYVMETLVYLSLARNVIVIILLTDISSEIIQEFNLTNYDKRLLSVGWTLATLPLLYITKVSVLAWFSFIGLLLYLLAIAVILFFCFLTFRQWNLKNISMEFDLQGIGIATGIIINSYAVHMNLPSLEGSLRNPKVYKRTSNITFIINIIGKIAFAICGYLSYLESTRQEITSNVNNYYPAPIIIRVAIMFFSYFTIPLQSFVVFELIDEKFYPYFPVCTSTCFWKFMSRGVCMVLCLLVSVVIPQFGLVVSLIGSMRGSMICLILPALFYVMLPTHEMNLYKRYISYFTVMFGVLAGVLGVYSSGAALITKGVS